MLRKNRWFRVWLVLWPVLGYLMASGAGDCLAAKKTCLDCHSEARKFLDRKVVHAPVKGGDCQACHRRHGFSNTLVLKAEGQGLCLSCHEPIRDEMNRGSNHPPAKNGNCIACHDPHGSDRK